MSFKKFFSLERCEVENDESQEMSSFIMKDDFERDMTETLLTPLPDAEALSEINIFLAEDSDDDYFLMSEALDRSIYKHKLTWLKNGKELIDKLEEAYTQTALPDLLLLDLNMPKVNGHEVLKFIKSDSRFKNILTIVLTSSKSPADIEMAYENGANAFLVKGSRFDKLVEAISSLKRFWFDYAQRPQT